MVIYKYLLIYMLNLVPVRFFKNLSYNGHSETNINHKNMLSDILQSKHISETATHVKE